MISHAGAGSLFEALAAGKAVVAVPNGLLMHNHQAPPQPPTPRAAPAQRADARSTLER